MTSKSDLMRTPPLDGASMVRPSAVRSDVIEGTPTAYHISFHTQVCRNCLSYHSFNHVSLSIMGARAARVFRPVSRFEYRLPVFVHHNETENIPACRSCAEGISLAHLLPPPAPVASASVRPPNWKAPRPTIKAIMTSADLEL